jgi:hypothetical protein
VLLVLGLVASAPAGEIHVPDSNATQGTCNVYPWGTSTEWRYHAIVPETMMGGKAVPIIELGFASCNSGTFASSKCEIRMAHLTKGKSPSTTFASNLEKDVTVVFSGSLNFAYTANQWSDVGLTQPFNYNGVDQLVVEVRYVGRTGGSSFHRGSTIPRIYKSGTGAYSATTATGNDMAALKMRFKHPDIRIILTGNPTPGGTVSLMLESPSDGGLPYQAACSFGLGPIVLGSRKLELSPDALMGLSTGGLLPTVFKNFAGILDNAGKGQADVVLPNTPVIKGLRIYNAFVTVDARAPFGLQSISPSELFLIQ